MFFVSIRYADKLARQCIQSIVDISKLIFTVTKTLEATTLPPHIAELYQPLDDLEGCTYFERDINGFTTNDFKVSSSLLVESLIFMMLIESFLDSISGFLQRISILPIAIADPPVLIDSIQSQRGHCLHQNRATTLAFGIGTSFAVNIGAAEHSVEQIEAKKSAPQTNELCAIE